jgi:Asp/Glu/hydantoin racemase
MASRVWYQSFVHPVQQAPYIERLQALLNEIARPDVRFEVHGLDSPVRSFDPLTEFRCAGQVICNGLEAEKGGYEAFVLGHFQEPGLIELRSAIDIPVVSLGEANLLAALSMGQRFGLVTIDPVFIPWHDRQVRGHGFGDRYVGTTAMKMNLPRFMQAFTDQSTYAGVRDEFAEQVKPLIAAGAEVILPAGGLPMLLFARESPFVIDGSPVLNGIAVVAKAAEMALALKGLTKTFVSRHSTYAKAPQSSIDEFLAAPT